MERCDHCDAECEGQYCEFCFEFAQFDPSEYSPSDEEARCDWYDDVQEWE